MSRRASVGDGDASTHALAPTRSTAPARSWVPVEGVRWSRHLPSGQPPTDRSKRTLRELLLPDLLPNGVTRAGTGRDEERFRAAKS